MKLNATLKNERGGRKGTSDNTRILIELSYGNKVVGEVGLYAIKGWNTGEELGYRVVWNDPERGYSHDNVLKEVEKGKTQQGKCEYPSSYENYPCGKCRGCSGL